VASGNARVEVNAAAEPAPAPPHQLIAPVADFTGRGIKLDELRRKVKQDGVAVTGVRGMGGAGKTELARRFADELKAEYPDAQIELDLKGLNPQSLSAAEVISAVLRVFHPTMKLPGHVEELSALLRRTLDGKRALLLLDNAKDGHQVGPLLPLPAGCLVVVTSRQRFVVPGLEAVDLGMMEQEEAQALLLKIAPRIGGQAEALAQICGRLPLALRLAGSLLAVREHIEAASYVRQLRDSRERLRLIDRAREDTDKDLGLEASFGLSFQQLTPAQQQQFTDLSIMAGSFDRAAMWAVWAVEESAAEETLAVLVRLSLLEWNRETQRFELHDLLKEFARVRAKTDELEAAKRRHVEHFIQVANEADRLYDSGGGNVVRGLKLFDLERGHMEAAFDWLASGTDKKAAGLLVSLVKAVGSPSHVRFEPRQSTRWLEAQAKAARLTGDRVGEGMAICNLGNAYGDLGDQRKATSLQEQALIIARESGDRRAEGICIGNLGHSYMLAGDPLKAIELLEQSLIIAREFRDQQGEAIVLCNLGIAHENQGSILTAIGFFEQQLAIAKVLGDRRCESSALCNLGAAFNHLQEMPKAIDSYEQALCIAREIGDKIAEGGILSCLACYYGKSGDTRKAIAFFEQAREIFRQIGNRRAEGEAVGNLGHSYTVLGNPRKAIELLGEALVAARETGNHRGEGHVLGNLAQAHMALADFPQAIELFSQAAAIASEVKDQREEALLLYNCALAMGSVGNRTQAIACTESALQIFRSIEVPPPTMLSAMLAEWREEEDIP
jgi:tetratricopeptide (TPR) repeat protein